VNLPQVDIAIAAGSWGAVKTWRPLVERAIAAAIEVAELDLANDSELSVLLTDDPGICELNARWRDRPQPTNVLSFPAGEQGDAVAAGELPRMLGDIVLARQTIETEAALAGKPFEHHFSHLVIHGFFHLFGYDHLEDSDAERMEDAERKALARLGIADPYDR
jgi:probable rRNA maturation factor